MESGESLPTVSGMTIEDDYQLPIGHPVQVDQPQLTAMIVGTLRPLRPRLMLVVVQAFSGNNPFSTNSRAGLPDVVRPRVANRPGVTTG